MLVFCSIHVLKTSLECHLHFPSQIEENQKNHTVCKGHKHLNECLFMEARKKPSPSNAFLTKVKSAKLPYIRVAQRKTPVSRGNACKRNGQM